MDRKTGMRRLGLLIGIAGALLGGVYSFSELKTILVYNKFNSLAESDFVKTEAASYISDVEKARAAYFEKERLIDAQIARVREKDGTENLMMKERLAAQAGVLAAQASENLFRIDKLHSEINRFGLKQIEWTYGYGRNAIDPEFPWPRPLDIVSVETLDGEKLYRTDAPNAWTYAIVILAPVLGFVFPWSAIWGIEWVLAGFSRKETI